MTGDMMAEKKPAQLIFDEATGDWKLEENESASEWRCLGGGKHDFAGPADICTRCGITQLEYQLRYGGSTEADGEQTGKPEQGN